MLAHELATVRLMYSLLNLHCSARAAIIPQVPMLAHELTTLRFTCSLLLLVQILDRFSLLSLIQQGLRHCLRCLVRTAIIPVAPTLAH